MGWIISSCFLFCAHVVLVAVEHSHCVLYANFFQSSIPAMIRGLHCHPLEWYSPCTKTQINTAQECFRWEWKGYRSHKASEDCGEGRALNPTMEKLYLESPWPGIIEQGSLQRVQTLRSIHLQKLRAFGPILLSGGINHCERSCSFFLLPQHFVAKLGKFFRFTEA